MNYKLSKNASEPTKTEWFFDPVDHERLSYYQMLTDDLLAAEETLAYILKRTPA